MRGLARAVFVLGLLVGLAPRALAQGTALVLDASESAKLAGAERVQAGVQRWLENAPGEVRAFGTGEASGVSRATAHVAFGHPWGGSSNLVDPIEEAAHWLAAVPGDRALVVISDLELDVVGADDAPAAILEGLPADADREQVNRHALDLFRERTLPRLRELGAKVVLVRLHLPEDARRVSLEQDLASLPGALVLDASDDPDATAAALSRALPKPAPTPSPSPSPSPTPTPRPTPSPSPSPTPTPSPVASPTAIATTETPPPEPAFPWRPIAGGLLLLLAVVIVVARRRRQPKIQEQRLVALGEDGRATAAEHVLRRTQVGRALSRIEVGSGALELEASDGGGVRAKPKGVTARIEGVPVSGTAGLVHGMVVEVEQNDGSSKSFVYLDRELNPSEKKRTWVEPSVPESQPLPPGKKPKAPAYTATSKGLSISDVGSVDDFYVVDESEETLVDGMHPFGDRQVFALDSDGKIAGEASHLKAHRLDATNAGVDIGGRTLEFNVDDKAGALLLPLGPRVRLTVEGVPVPRAGLALVHGMVFDLEGKRYLYLDREPTALERGRSHSHRDSRSREESISDVGSSDELLVVDDSEDGSAPPPDEE